MNLDTTNVHHSDAFTVFQNHPIQKVVRHYLGQVYFGYRSGGGIYVSTHQGGPELGIGLTVRQALDHFMEGWNESMSRTKAGAG